MGVWIEIPVAPVFVIMVSSLPVWECGLKWKAPPGLPLWLQVTPCMGVWIEIL